MKIIVKIVAIILTICCLLNGCMSTNSLNDLTVVQAMGVDNVGDETKVTLQYLDLSKSGNATDTLDGNITAVSSGLSSNISDAISYATKSLSQKIFMGQNKIIVFGNEYSNIGIDKGIDYLIRSIDSRPDVLVAMSDSSAEDILKNKQNGARIPAESIYKMLKLGEENGIAAVVSVNDLLNLYKDETTDVYLPVLKSNEDGVSCEGIVCFSDEKLAVSLDSYQTNGFLFIKNKISGGTLLIENDEFGFIGIDIVKARCKPSASVINGEVVFKCEMSVSFLLNELEKGSTSYLTPERVKEIERLVKKLIYDMSLSCFKACVSKNSDPFAIGKYLARDDLKSFNAMKGNWHSNLKNTQLDLQIKTEMKNINDSNFKE